MWRSAALMLCLGGAGLALSACQMTSPFGGAKPAAVASPAQTPEPSAKPGTAIPAGTLQGKPSAVSAPKGDERAAQPASAPPSKPAVEAEAEPAPPKSAPQLACEATGGIWSVAGKAGVKTCVQRTRDAGKSCKREGDCQGFCLARSRSCAPVTPLFGCNDILQADGGQVTLCID